MVKRLMTILIYFLPFIIGTCIINIMLNLLFNIRYDSDDKELFDIISMNEKVTTSSSLTDPIGWMKWLRHIYHSKNYIQLLDALAQRDKFLSKHLKEHLQTYQEGVQRDFTDFLIKYSSNSKSGSVASHSNLEMILMDMIFAGTETTLTALEWMVVYLIHWPEYQDKLFNDILENTGKGRYPGLRDRYKLHFVQAFIHEALRFSSFVPLNVPHKTLADEKFDFYSIPKGTTVFYNFWAIHHDEKEFQEPDTFNPHRWIDDDGNFRNSKSFILFSVGKRACLGENLARSELFLFLTRLVRDFKILAEPNVPLPELDGVIGTVLVPVPFKATFHSRE